jgi:hypothetical protein
MPRFRLYTLDFRLLRQPARPIFRLYGKAEMWDIPGMARMKKNAAAVALGRLGGLKGGKARARKLTAKQRRASARNAALVRWSRKKS